MSRPYAAKLQELLQASNNLPNAVCDLGRVELGPLELEEVTRSIYEHDKVGIDAKAHYLLAASGFNAEQVLSEIAKIRLPSSDRARGANLGATMRVNSAPTRSSRGGLMTQTTTPLSKPGSIERLVAQNFHEFDSFIDKQLDMDWAARKREIVELLDTEGSSSSSSSSSAGPHKQIFSAGSSPSKAPKTQTSGGSAKLAARKRQGARILGPPSSEPTKFTSLMRGYAEVVTALCDNEFQLPDVVKMFANVASQAASAASTASGASTSGGGSGQGYVLDSWQALQLNNPLLFLETQYREHIDAEIRTHRQDAKLGGVPSNFSKIKAYVALKYLRHDTWDSRLTLINKTPIWAYLYYLVRAGHFEEALQLVLERKDIFETMGSSFAVYFKAWVDSPSRTLSPHYNEMIRAEYHQLFRPSLQGQVDPYKQALYKVIGRCDLSKRTLPQVAVTTEDWLWLQLRLCQPESPYTVEQLRAYILDIGPTHLAGDSLKYFTILIMLGLYSNALTFLREHDEIHAVHYAIALLARGLLSVSDMEKFGFNQMVGHYTRHFRQAMPNLAVDYLVTLAVPQVADGYEAARQACQELVLETRRFSELLGDVTTFTDHSFAGSIEKRMNLLGLHDKKEYLSKIAHEVAQKADEDGRVVDAILLFRLAGESERVLQLVNTQLGLLLSGVPLGQPVSSALSPSFDILQLARNVMRIDGDSLSRSESKETCMILLAIAECLDLLAKQDYQSCLERISQTGLLVLLPEPAVTQVRELAQRFMNYDESIARNIPYVLLMTMTCIVNITEQLRSSETPVAGRLLDQYRGRANNCMVYAGLVQFRMPREIYSRLTQLEAQLA